jgi:hypothetical protein
MFFSLDVFRPKFYVYLFVPTALISFTIYTFPLASLLVYQATVRESTIAYSFSDCIKGYC